MFKHMKIAKKLLAAFLVVTILSSIAGVVGVILLFKLDSGYSSALINNGFSQGDIGTFNTYLNKGGAVVRDIIFLTEKSQLEVSQKELESIKTYTTDSLKRLKETCTTPAELEQVKIIETSLSAYQQERDKVVALGLANKNEEALALFLGTARPYLNTCMEAAQKLMDINVELGNTVSMDLTRESRTAITTMFIIIAIALVFSILLAVFISRSISRPVQRCADRLVQFAEGDLHSAVPQSDSEDETGIMLRSLKSTVEGLSDIVRDVSYHMGELSNGNLTTEVTREYKGDFAPLEVAVKKIIVSLNDAMSQINQSADQVSSGSDQVASGAQALSQGATEQASSIEELSASIAEISEQVKQNASNAANASLQATDVEREIENGDDRMKKLMGAMADISNSSAEIGKIIKTIDDIAFQTNILALNAAVEAARAGAAGKGFAVVADEVRNLAGKSAEAASNTTSLIENSIKAVENGTKMADETAKALGAMTEGARKITSLISEISDASNDQSNSIAQVTLGVEQISAVVQTNSATAEESAAASEELSGQAQMLKSLVGRFRLKAQSELMAAEHSVSFTGPVEQNLHMEVGSGTSKY